jgi:hypothetical protein
MSYNSLTPTDFTGAARKAGTRVWFRARDSVFRFWDTKTLKKTEAQG